MLRYDPERWLQLYDEGHITDIELLFRLVQAAASHPPEEIAAFLPSQQLTRMREESADPPESLESSLRYFHMGMWSGPGPHELREEQRLWFEGVWQWHRYFNRDRP